MKRNEIIYILEAELTIFVDELDVSDEEKQRMRGQLKGLCLEQ